MIKRNATPSGVNSGRKLKVKIPIPKIRNYKLKEKNKLILPLLKDNLEQKNKNKSQSQKNLYQYDGSIIQTEKNRVNIKNILSPIKKELGHFKKRGSGTEREFSQKNEYKLNEKTGRINDTERHINNFNRGNKKKSNTMQIKNLPAFHSSKNTTQVKLPLIESNLYHVNRSDKKLNEIIPSQNHDKNKSDSILNSKYHLEKKQFATYSRKGTGLDCKNKENNQDVSIIFNDVCGIEDYNIYGIMDGHGSNGHLVSNFVKEKVQEYFGDINLYKKKKMTKSISEIEIDNSGKIYQKLIHNNYEIIRNFYKQVNDELYNTKFDIHFSGSTCVLVFKIGQKLICSNVGDSRSILVKNKITLNKSNLHDIEYDYVQLSYDHKPNNKEEKERIEKSGGEVAQEYFIDKQDEPAGPFRVWNKGCNYPGIAISRSLGDKIAELIGVISEPDILEFDIDNNCKYIIMGSDGLFDHLSNDDIMRIAEPFLIKNNPDKACFDVVEKAAQLFKEKENRIDDITINLIIL